MDDNTLKRLHKDICMLIETYEFENDHLDYKKFKSIINNYI